MRHIVDAIFNDSPRVHQGETETRRVISPSESILPEAALQSLAAGEPVCWGIAKEAGLFLYDAIKPGWRTLETGAGLSTLVFALARARHIAVTPNPGEVTAIKNYAAAKGIGLGSVRFVVAKSEEYLPRAKPTPLDCVLIDGKHAFPWPMLDWFYTAGRLRKGGLLALDDLALPAVDVLRRFLDGDERWRARERF
ncbi:MAG: class I SAM-dependent methyltransferase, partial [Desulfovibrionaceae bacterium]|nr:class I SAM-dependent methyltransferase [Desulfovibrionaceae bacterium]